MTTKVGLELVPGTRADAAAGVALRRLADIAEDNLPGAIAGSDLERLHDLRVAVRRARSVLRELRGVHPEREHRRLRRELKWVQAATGPVRDLDVQLEEWDDLLALLPADRREALTYLRVRLQGRMLDERAAMTSALRSPRFVAAMEAWRALAERPAGRDDAGPRAADPIETLAGKRIRAVYRRMVRDGRDMGPDAPDEAFHDLRKRGKELRYLLELFGGLFPREVVKPMVTTLKGLQDVLGRFQDRSVQAERLRAEPEPEIAAVVSALLADQARARGEFAERFAAFAAPEQRALVKRTF